MNSHGKKVEDQIHDIWKVFEKQRIRPSTEYLNRMNNIFIGAEGNVTMFDFNAYLYEHAESKFLYNHTLETENKNRLLADIRRLRAPITRRAGGCGGG